jgi:hypothetical protein
VPNSHILIVWALMFQGYVISVDLEADTIETQVYRDWTKVETPYHDNDLIQTPILSPQSG